MLDRGRKGAGVCKKFILIPPADLYRPTLTFQICPIKLAKVIGTYSILIIYLYYRSPPGQQWWMQKNRLYPSTIVSLLFCIRLELRELREMLRCFFLNWACYKIVINLQPGYMASCAGKRDFHLNVSYTLDSNTKSIKY